MADPKSAVLGSLLLSVVRPGTDALVRRALVWARDLDRLGVEIALPVVHDLGLLIAVPSSQVVVGARRNAASTLHSRPGWTAAHVAYVAAMQSLATDPTLEQVRALRPSDDLVVVLLTRLLAGGREGRATRRGSVLEGATTADLFDLERRLPVLFAEAPRDPDLQAIARFVETIVRLRVVLDTIDLDTLKLLSVFGHGAADAAASGAGALAGIAQVELLSALSSLQANDVVNFSLELLPAVLETTRGKGVGTFATGGYQGLARRGSLDSMVLTELAWDDEELSRRLLDDEVLFHARERSEEQAPRLHLVLVDASASMRGDRTTFARGVAIALAKRLELEGEEARIRFFDGRLYESFGGASSGPRGQRRGTLASALPHLLAFRGERGRSPERVLRQLVAELEVLRVRDRRSPVVHLITHAAFYAPRALVQEVRARAALFAVFITPHKSDDDDAQIDLDWLDELDGYFAVDQATIGKKGDRAARGKEIVRGMPKEQAPASARARAGERGEQSGDAPVSRRLDGPKSGRKHAEPKTDR